GRPRHANPVPLLIRRFGARFARILLLAVFIAASIAALASVSCTTTPKPAPAPLPSASEAPVPVPALRVAIPETPARSGVLFRVGLKSDLTELSIGTAGTLWVVASGERAELM